MRLCQSQAALGCAERVALCALRRALRGQAGPCRSVVCPFGLGRDTIMVQGLFAAIWQQEPNLQDFCELGEWRATGEERRLLRALAAAQAENDDLLNRYLVSFTPERSAQQCLKLAIEALAANLAVHGYWLPQLRDLLQVPASALPLLRVHGQDLALAQVAWPMPAS